MTRILSFPLLLVALLSSAPANEPNSQDRGSEILDSILAQAWAKSWKPARLEGIRLVTPKPDQKHPTGLPAVWTAKVRGARDQPGILMWDSANGGQLVEFTLDAKLTIEGENARAVTGVPALQQFAIEGDDGKSVASGCVPTAAASVLSYWVTERFPQWKGEGGKTPQALTRRLRSRLQMSIIPDEDGFTENGMSLAGAWPRMLAKVIRADAAEHAVAITCDYKPFSMEKLKEEIEAARPVLVSCIVRVPHKPELSWGHELAAVAWAEIDGVEMVGVLDNFFPTKHPETIRWIRNDAFDSMIMIRPLGEQTEPAAD